VAAFVKKKSFNGQKMGFDKIYCFWRVFKSRLKKFSLLAKDVESKLECSSLERFSGAGLIFLGEA
jgi:hypothetical protein